MKPRDQAGRFETESVHTPDWSTLPCRPPRKYETTSWKDYLREKCPHGLLIVLVDGTHVRNVHDSDFCQGGNGFAYPFIPKNEIWVDNCIPPGERALVAFHECVEAELMRGGASYDRAHGEAKRREDAWRRARSHSSDPDCAGHVDPETGECSVCHVLHGDPCPSCGGRGYHAGDCPDVGR